ncbi:hypothetical protein [Thermogemmatispora tikiterensis]|uniref:hypothetical protein n=1 Tax=Thermogemmatispora tikiterensis TaxID=1825093 RepID=UPI0011BE4F10|nr:hypothetical protein [Thermogemmatispora tikiterensis]
MFDALSGWRPPTACDLPARLLCLTGGPRCPFIQARPSVPLRALSLAVPREHGLQSSLSPVVYPSLFYNEFFGFPL